MGAGVLAAVALHDGVTGEQGGPHELLVQGGVGCGGSRAVHGLSPAPVIIRYVRLSFQLVETTNRSAFCYKFHPGFVCNTIYYWNIIKQKVWVHHGIGIINQYHPMSELELFMFFAELQVQILEAV